MKFRKEATFCRDFPLLEEKSQTKKTVMQRNGKQQNTTLIFSKKQATDFSLPKKSWLKNIREMAVQ